MITRRPTIVLSGFLFLMVLVIDADAQSLYSNQYLNGSDQLGTIDPATAAFTPIAPIAGDVDESALDPVGHRLFFRGQVAGADYLYTIDLKTLHVTPSSGQLSAFLLLFDPGLGNLYGHQVLNGSEQLGT